jgi:multicomponent Na+:H+ antiporter subunit B
MMMALGSNFLQHSMGDLHLPFFGDLHWTTALLFDLGVYLAVVGSALTMIEVLGRQ